MISRVSTRLSKLTLWQIDALGLGLCVALGGLWYAVGIAPLAQARAQRAALVTTVAEMEEEAKRMVHVKRAQDKSLAAAQAKLDSSGIKLAPADQINQRVSALTGLATANGLRFDEIKPGTPTALERHTSVPIQVSGQGGYRGIAVFLHALREQYPDIGLTQFEIRGEPAALDRPARYSLQLVWYAAPSAGVKKK